MELKETFSEILIPFFSLTLHLRKFWVTLGLNDGLVTSVIRPEVAERLENIPEM